MVIINDMTKATARFLTEPERSPYVDPSHNESDNIMAHKKDFDAIQQAILQIESERNTQEQADLIANEPQRQILKLLLIGSPEVVQSAIHYLQLIGYAEVGEWSRSLTIPDSPEEVMRILLRKIMVQ